MTVPAVDGVRLKGIIDYPDPGGRPFPLAVLAHQYPATSDSYAPLVEDLLDLGFATVAFDLRGHGSSIESPDGPVVIDTPADFSPDAFGTAFMASAAKVRFRHIADDIVRAAAWGAAQNHVDGRRILLVGASVGGTGALLAAPRLPGLGALVTFGAAGAPAHGEDAARRIRQNVEAFSAPVLLTSSAEDPFDGAANARAWSDGLSHARSLIVPGSAHAMAIYYEVRHEVLAFVRDAFA